MVYEEPDGPDMVLEPLGEGKRLPDQAADPLSGGQVEAFHVAGVTTPFADGLVLFARDHERVGPPEIGVAEGLFLIPLRQGVPQRPRATLIACAYGHSDHPAALGFQRDPHPLRVALAADEAPQLIALQD